MAFAVLALALPAQSSVTDQPHFKVLGTVIVWGADAASGAPIVSDFVIDTGNGTTGAASGDADLVAGDVHTVVTGSLVSTHDAINAATGTMPYIINNTGSGNIDTDSNGDGILTGTDAFSAFSLTGSSNERVNTTRTRSSFYVASNVPFAIDAQAQSPVGFNGAVVLAVTFLDVSVTQSGSDAGIAFGSAAQFPHTGGATGGVASTRRLSTLRTPDRIFTGNQQTAASPGSITDQSVRFDLTYTINAANLAGYDLSLGTFDFEVDMVYTVYVP